MHTSSIKPLARVVLFLCLVLCPSCLSYPSDIYAEMYIKNETGIPIHITERIYVHLLEKNLNNEEISNVNFMEYDLEDIEYEKIFSYMIGIGPDAHNQFAAEEEQNPYVEIRDMDGNLLVTWRPNSENDRFYDESNWQVTQEFSGKCRHKSEHKTWLFVITPEMLGLE